MRELAVQNLSKAHYLAGKLKPRFTGPFFNEFVAQADTKTVAEINRTLEAKKIIGGLALERFHPAQEYHAAVLYRDEQETANGSGGGGVRVIKKVRQHPSRHRPVDDGSSSPGKKGHQLPDLDVPTIDAAEALKNREHSRHH